MKSPGLIAAVTLIFLNAACAEAGGMVTKPVYQSIEYGNGGQGPVRDLEIVYGTISLPQGSANRTLVASPLATVREGLTASVPESATIRWTSTDGQHHEVMPPMRSFVSDAACFHGFKFVFEDDHLDIYLLNRKYDCTKLLDVERIKVYSSAK